MGMNKAFTGDQAGSTWHPAASTRSCSAFKGPSGLKSKLLMKVDVAMRVNLNLQWKQGLAKVFHETNGFIAFFGLDSVVVAI
jgi:hypothetical protein